MSHARYNNSFRQLSGCDPMGKASPRRRTGPTRSDGGGLGAGPVRSSMFLIPCFFIASTVVNLFREQSLLI